MIGIMRKDSQDTIAFAHTQFAYQYCIASYHNLLFRTVAHNDKQRYTTIYHIM